MMPDPSSFPVSGSAILGLVAYAGVSLLGGQLVATRQAEQLEWQPRCEAGLQAEIADRQRPRRALPQTDCSSVVGRWHPDLERLCRQYGNPDLGGPAAEAERELLRRKRAIEDRRLARAAAETGNRCACAARVYARDHLLSLGLYAGTARLISLPGVTGMESGLRQALGSPYCQAAREGRS